MMEELSRELDFSYRRCGALVLCFEESGLPQLRELLRRGEENGVEGLGDSLGRAAARDGARRVGGCRGRAVGADERDCLPLRPDDRAGGERRGQRHQIPL